jgi:uncharacterized protein
MNLSEQIKDDIKVAMKGRDMQTLTILRGLSSSMKNKSIDLKKELEDAEVIAVVKSDVKKLKDALETFVSAAREDLVKKTKEEIEVLKKYLPAEMSDEDLEAKVKEVLEKEDITDAADIGKAMGAAMAELKGQADGGRVKEMVGKLLK